MTDTKACPGCGFELQQRERNVYYCPGCDDLYNSDPFLHIHVSDESDGDGRFHCSICDKWISKYEGDI